MKIKKCNYLYISSLSLHTSNTYECHIKIKYLYIISQLCSPVVSLYFQWVSLLTPFSNLRSLDLEKPARPCGKVDTTVPRRRTHLYFFLFSSLRVMKQFFRLDHTWIHCIMVRLVWGNLSNIRVPNFSLQRNIVTIYRSMFTYMYL